MTTLADILRPPAARAGESAAADAGRALLFDLLLVLSGSFLVALAAQAAIQLPFMPVPFTGQTFAVLLVSAALGRRRAVAAMTAYLAEGAAGLPVFAGGAAGPHVLIGPTGGYLLGFVAAGWIVGGLAERGLDRRPLGAAAAMAAGIAAILILGSAWLSRFIGAADALRYGVVPFLAGDVVKIALASGLLPLTWRLAGRGSGVDTPGRP